MQRKVQYRVVNTAEEKSLVAVVDGNMYVFDDKHPHFSDAVEAALDGDGDTVLNLHDATKRIAEKFNSLSERVSVAHSRLYLDGDEIEDVYADLVVELVDNLEDEVEFLPYVKFLEKVYTNTQKHTRDNLSRWLQASGSFTITEEGNIIGYKGLRTDNKSVRSGPAVVNGVAVNGNVPNEPGSVITMARSKVEHNPARGCASGLHVGTWDYASDFGQGVVAEVEVNPRDVVSVPTDCNGQKMRVSRYKVVRFVNEKHEETVIPSGFEPTEDYIDGYIEGYDDADNGYPAQFEN